MKDKLLFTPGPLTTSPTVKEAMLHDLGSRDDTFIHLVKEIRSRLLTLGGVDESEYTAIIMQGSGTFGIEAVISSVIPQQGKLLVLINGAYGERIYKIAGIHHIDAAPLRFPENTVPDPEILEIALKEDSSITHIAAVHCETTTGIINPIEIYGELAHKYGASLFVDAMSSFGAYPVDLKASNIDFLVSSSNKNIEGVPGFSFVLARKTALELAKDNQRSLSLDLYSQWQGLESSGQFRFTPPTHAILAFNQALDELEEEGGVRGRGKRYQENYLITLTAMKEMGFELYLDEKLQGYIISSYYYPDHPNFSFPDFYQALSEKGFVIYPGKLSHADCFRIGHIGRLAPQDVKGLMSAIAEVLTAMDLT